MDEAKKLCQLQCWQIIGLAFEEGGYYCGRGGRFINVVKVCSSTTTCCIIFAQGTVDVINKWKQKVYILWNIFGIYKKCHHPSAASVVHLSNRDSYQQLAWKRLSSTLSLSSLSSQLALMRICAWESNTSWITGFEQELTSRENIIWNNPLMTIIKQSVPRPWEWSNGDPLWLLPYYDSCCLHYHTMIQPSALPLDQILMNSPSPALLLLRITLFIDVDCIAIWQSSSSSCSYATPKTTSGFFCKPSSIITGAGPCTV